MEPLAAAEEKIVEVDGLKYTYGTGRAALDHVGFEVRRGEIFGLLGPNGSGKTTLFRILSTAFPPHAGSVRIGGHSLETNLPQARSRLGVVFQSPSLDTKLSVRENLFHQGLIYGISGAALQDRCREMMEQLGISDRAGELVGRLSGGLKRRVELAKGLLHRPEILILDEPSTGLDPGARADLWRYLKKLRDEAGMTVLVTTHLMEEAEHCDRLLILNEGRVIRIGAPAELRSELHGDVLDVESERPEELADLLRGRKELSCRVVDGTVRIECERGAEFVPELVKAYPSYVKALTLRKPTLEDVFIHYTGHRFWNEEEKPE